MQYIDLTHTFKLNMPVYPGDLEPKLKQVHFIDDVGYNGFQVKTTMHVGTHMEAPLHLLVNGKRISEYTPEHFFGNGYLIDARGKSIDLDLLAGKSISKGGILLVMTGFYKKFNTAEYYEAYPEMSGPFVSKIVELGVKIVGMDIPSPDRPPYTLHKILLERGILIIENLTNLELLVGKGKFNVVALPTKFDSEAAPVRVVAQLTN
jgi:kynurenine formamidase